MSHPTQKPFFGSRLGIELVLENFIILRAFYPNKQPKISEPVAQRCSEKKMFLEISQNSQEQRNT